MLSVYLISSSANLEFIKEYFRSRGNFVVATADEADVVFGVEPLNISDVRAIARSAKSRPTYRVKSDMARHSPVIEGVTDLNDLPQLAQELRKLHRELEVKEERA